jgi:UDP-glucoronosyl and UDP-glucosyl transferase
VRILFTSVGRSGHFNPLVPLIDAAVARGDEVLVVTPPELESTLVGRGYPYRLGAAPPKDEADEIWRRFPTVPKADAAVLANREFFGRLCTAAMLPTVEEVCRTWRPDLVLHEPCEFASAVAACRLGITHAQVAISLAEVEWSSLDLIVPALEPYGDQIDRQVRESPYLTRFPATLDPSQYSVTRRFREAAAGLRGAPLPDWWAGSADPLVYLTFGSVTGGHAVAAAAFRAAVDAVRDLPVRALLTIGRHGDESAFGPVPDNVHVEQWVPQADVLGQAAALVCHGGSGTTFGALAAGLPMVFVPLFADQPVNARLVSAAGAGVTVLPSAGPEGAMGVPGPEDSARIRAALETVLDDASYRNAARGIAAEMAAMPTAGELLGEMLAELAPDTRRR